MSQAEMLEAMSPAPFNQSKAVPKDAEVQHTHQERWWRSDSPREEGDPHPDLPKTESNTNLANTQGVLGHGQRHGRPGAFHTNAQTGPATSPFKTEGDAPATIAG